MNKNNNSSSKNNTQYSRIPKEIRFTAPNAFRLLLSLFIAVLLWVFVTGTQSDDYERTFNGVQLQFSGESSLRETKDLIITNIGSNSVRVTIKGNRRTVAKLDAADLTATVDVSGISHAGEYTVSYKISYPGGTDSSELQVTAKYPDTISYYVDKLGSVMVPVQGIFSGSAAENYSVEEITFSPETVKVTGPQSELEKIECAWIEVTRENVDKTVTFESAFQLLDADGEVIVPDDENDLVIQDDTVEVTLPVIFFKDVDLTVNIIDGGGATENDVKIQILPSKVTLSGDTATLNGINSITLSTIDLSEVEGSVTETYSIVIPNDCTMLSGSREATVSLEILGLETREIEIPETNFSFINATEGFDCEIMTNHLAVKLRGSSEDIAGVTDVNVRAVADLTGFGTATGIVSAPVKIYVDGTTDVGAIGSYRVYVNITESVPDDEAEVEEDGQ